MRYTSNYALRRKIIGALFGLVFLLPVISGCDYYTMKEKGNPNPVDPGGNNGDTLAVKVVISPGTTTLSPGRQQQFTATVTGSTNGGVTWSIASGTGSIDGGGVYTAPAAIPAETIVAVIRATSIAEPRAIATAVVNVVRGSTPGDTTGTGGKDEVCFERDVMPILRSNCAMSGCHAAPGQEGYVFTSYETIMNSRGDDDDEDEPAIVPGNPGRSELYEKITEDRADKRMPPPPNNPLTAAQIETIRKWIAEGAKNTTCEENGNDCDTVGVTFSGTVLPTLQNNCLGCHSGPLAPKGIRLDSYDAVRKQAVSGKLYGVISHSPGFVRMPYAPYGGAKLPECTIAKIKAWIDRGAPND